MNEKILGLSMLSLAIAGTVPAQEEKEAGEKAPAAAEKPASAAALPRVALETSLGRIVLELDEEKAPLTVANFLGYVEDGYYDGTVFHRVIGNFMIQGGGFELVEEVATQKKPKEPIKNEAKNGLKNARGSIAMARTPNPHSATSQFFINVKDNPGLDPNPRSPDGYAVFGKVVEGMDVVDKIKAVPTGEARLMMLHPQTGEHFPKVEPDVPQEPVVIKTARRVEKEADAGKKEE